jgi:HD superfamily phosphohydrolase
MHLAGLAWSKIKDNQIRIRNFCDRYRKFSERECQARTARPVQGLLTPTFLEIEKIFSSPYVLQALRLSALLHDIGHPPFSHSGERFLPDWKTTLRDNHPVPPYLKSFFESRANSEEGEERVQHEVFTILLIDELLRDIYYRKPHLRIKVSPQDIASIIIPDINPETGSELTSHSALCLCRELISGEIDIDRMDYLRRDAKECGVAYGHFDVDRILDSLSMYSSTEDGKIHLALKYSGLSALEDYLRARHSMYVQLYFHKTATASEAMMQRLSRYLGNWHLPAKVSEYCALDEYEIRSYLGSVSKQKLPKREQTEVEDLMKDLFVNRRLWKMVYEITEEKEHRNKPNPELQEVIKFLDEEKIDHEAVSSHTVLTKFRSLKSGEKNTSCLRLIKLDERQLLRVEAVEDHSSIAKENGVVFHRIYVSQEDAIEAKATILEILETRDLSGSSSV